MKIILLVLDGAADRPCSLLSNKTPLQVASTKKLDRLATLGSNGLLFPQNKYLAPSTDFAHFLFLGYTEDKYPGRGYIEALGNEIPIGPNQLALSTLFVSTTKTNRGRIIRREETSIAERDALNLSKSITKYRNGPFSATFHHVKNRRGILVISGPISKDITDTDPFVDGFPVIKSRPLNNSKDYFRATNTAGFLNIYTRWCYRQLSKHPLNKKRVKKSMEPVNVVISKWPGIYQKLTPFEKLTGLRGAVVAKNSLFKGMSLALNLKFVEVPKSLSPKKETEVLINSLPALFESGIDFVLLHTKAADEAAHTKNPENKVKAIEEIDKGISPLFKLLEAYNIVLAVTADHSTPSEGTLIHGGDPTPLVILSSTLLKDEVNKFSERDARRGLLGNISGSNLMGLLLNASDNIRYSGSTHSKHQSLGPPTKHSIEPLDF